MKKHDNEEEEEEDASCDDDDDAALDMAAAASRNRQQSNRQPAEQKVLAAPIFQLTRVQMALKTCGDNGNCILAPLLIYSKIYCLQLLFLHPHKPL